MQQQTAVRSPGQPSPINARGHRSARRRTSPVGRYRATVDFIAVPSALESLGARRVRRGRPARHAADRQVRGRQRQRRPATRASPASPAGRSTSINPQGNGSGVSDRRRRNDHHPERPRRHLERSPRSLTRCGRTITPVSAPGDGPGGRRRPVRRRQRAARADHRRRSSSTRTATGVLDPGEVGRVRRAPGPDGHAAGRHHRHPARRRCLGADGTLQLPGPAARAATRCRSRCRAA